MKNTIKVSGLAALIAAIALNTLLITACSRGEGDSGGGEFSGSGTFTLDGIPETYNGKYAKLTVDEVIGAQSVTPSSVTLVQIINESVTLPLWVKTQDGIQRFYGQRLYGVTIGIYNSRTVYESSTPIAVRYFNQINLSSGSTTGWNQGKENP